MSGGFTPRGVGGDHGESADHATAGEVVSEPAPHGRHGFHPFPRRGAVVTNELIDRLREEEDE